MTFQKPATRAAPVTEAAPRKRITFACGGRPDVKPAEPNKALRSVPMAKVSSAQEAPRRSCIKFACPAPRPASTQNTPPRKDACAVAAAEKGAQPPSGGASPARKFRSPRPQLLRRVSKENRNSRTVAVDSADLENDSAQFHEFASEKMREDDWVRHEREDTTTVKRKITINDTLVKENRFRQIATEAEEEAAAEEEEDDIAGENDDNEDDEDDVESDDCEEDEEEEDDDDDEDDETENGSEDGDDGYRTDEETGFAESDDEGDSDLDLWTPSQNRTVQGNLSSSSTRRFSTGDHHPSDSSSSVRPVGNGKAGRVPIRSTTPELPDSTDFVCGTLDEDRPMEEAYLSCLAARKASKRHIIPQDIDPSFPTSDPEDDEAEERFNPVHHDSDDDDWLHGEMDDLHHEQERNGGRKKTKAVYSPKRLHSPPPKTKVRGRSPRPGQASPRPMRSPAPKAFTSTRVSPTQSGAVIGFVGLSTRVGLTQTKSLPRPPAMFPHAKHGKKPKAAPRHVRGAIDIVKGLESKRQRRKEKFFQKYCNRARKGQVPERRPLPGHGAERMKALGLLMAGKSNTKEKYVTSV